MSPEEFLEIAENASKYLHHEKYYVFLKEWVYFVVW